MSGGDSGFSYEFYFACAAASSAFFVILFLTLPYISTRICQGYDRLSRGQKLDFDSRVNSSVHAVAVGLASLYIGLFDDQLQDVAWGCSHSALLVCAVVLGYMIADVLIIAWHRKFMWSTTFVVHHLLVSFVEYFVILNRKCVWFALYRHVSELSTPFVNERASLDAIGYPRSSRLFLVNGILMAVSFFVVRVAAIPLYYYLVYGMHLSGHSSATLGFMWYFVLYGGTFLDILNVFWFYKIALGGMKLIRDVGIDKKSETQKYQ